MNAVIADLRSVSEGSIEDWIGSVNVPSGIWRSVRRLEAGGYPFLSSIVSIKGNGNRIRIRRLYLQVPYQRV
jgi:hypothetical protein